MEVIFYSLFSVFAIILTGYILKTIKFPTPDFWTQLDKLTYYLFFPCMLIYSMSTANFSSDLHAEKFVFIAFLAILIMSIFLIILQLTCKFDNREFTSLYQGSVRYNTYVFVAIVEVVYKDYGLTLAIFLMTFMIPIVNIFSVSIFSFFARNDKKFSYKKMVMSILTNPLILACIIGGILNYTGIGLPKLIKPVVKSLGDPAILLGLLSVGVGLKFNAFKTLKATFWLAPILKLICLPILALVLGHIFNLHEIMLGVLVLYCAMPTATNSYILAKQLGGDVELISAIITAEVIFSFFTISFFIIKIL